MAAGAILVDITWRATSSAIAAAVAAALMTLPVGASSAGTEVTMSQNSNTPAISAAVLAPLSGAKSRTRVRGWSTRTLRVSSPLGRADRVRVKTPDRRDRRVVLLRRAPGDDWDRIQRGRTNRRGAFVAVLTAPGPGAWEFRLKVRATGKSRPTRTQVRRLYVGPVADGSGNAAKSAEGRLSAKQQRMLDAINKARSSGRRCGSTFYPAAKALRVSKSLGKAAQSHAKAMARRNFFSHQGGSTPQTRARVAGYAGLVAENIAAGVSSVAAATRLWVRSPGHCANLMNSRYRSVGFGHAYEGASRWDDYWVQLFGTR